ncbi:glutamine--fructose-6-phosphate transaminase (isomerizing) [Caminibacter pacificus]|uniref:Glutamine--fructose-6-phosphate aminotransferase [isomerizing] n=1 Tax=Caminibacter pacificus TaxID=1424653 RepID=A0AAJ4RDH2_9BACT|nr:glutamine--fructose-6-phosphate transaminase (isomerizing) [Caminibacter pacificus]QCI27554.1 glutamine--fructose-6-phosphate transaminase (isomerizing) [Caminibacter pacificus]ROR40268.1 glucosamine--fructose-6-phosphate aminotransferase (isomerizing) [Caminibacter pacificus]
MCGIVGCIGIENVVDYLIEGLKELEYRGYDSAGIAVLDNGELKTIKAVGKIKNLEDKISKVKLNKPSVGIAHTRWATHGKPTEINAHPHRGEFSAVVHNGIIENYQEIKKFLQKEGVNFLSQTDTEVIVKLFEYYYNGDEVEAFQKTLEKLDGAYAILLISEKFPKKILFAKKGSPLIVAKNENKIYFASSDAPLIGHATTAHYLEDDEWGWVDEEIHIFKGHEKLSPRFKDLPNNKESAKKSGFRFYMEKEIYEQYDVLKENTLGRNTEYGIHFEELDREFFEGINNIIISACGTSYHAGLVGKYLLERDAKIRTNVEVASELRYREPLLTKDTLFVVISQSGETADTLETLKMAKKAGLKTLALCNVDNSSIVREADRTILLRAGIEKGVASTKAFATQVMTLWMLSNYLAKKNEYHIINEAIEVTKVDATLHEKIKRLSKRYLHGHGFFYIGRDIFFPLALEGALKLKEISYIHAEGYPAGEMKHGPIALADPDLYVVALLSKNILFEKTKSNIEELVARDATVLTISSEYIEMTDDFVKINDTSHPMVEFFEMMVVTQLLAMEVAIRMGNDVDMPRNLAKSVTVE